MSSLLLLEPYRSAMMAEGINLGLVSVTGGFEVSENSSYVIGSNKDLQQRVREICLFYDEVMFIHHEEKGEAEELERKGHHIMSALRMEESGIVRFPVVPTDMDRIRKLESSMHSLEDWWNIERELIETWMPLIASQLMARGKLPHESLLNILYADRIGDQELRNISEDLVPEEYKGFIPTILNGYKPYGFDFSVFSSLNEILDSEKILSNHSCHIAIDGFFGGTATLVTGNQVSGVVRILLESLLEEDFRFPIPENLVKMTKFRHKESLASFREVFTPWLQQLSIGGKDEAKLRKEVKKALKQFKNYRRLALASDVTAVISIPIGFAGLEGGLIGATLGLSSMGLSKLSAKWESDSKWVALCPNKSQNA